MDTMLWEIVSGKARRNLIKYPRRFVRLVATKNLNMTADDLRSIYEMIYLPSMNVRTFCRLVYQDRINVTQKLKKAKARKGRPM